MTESKQIRSGGCRCGVIRFEVGGEPLGGIACHCRDCQYAAGGSPNLSWIFARAGFALLSGQPKTFKATLQSGGSSFCSECGVQVYSQPDSNADIIAIKVGCFDDASGFQVNADMWLRSAAHWHRPHEGAARYDRNFEEQT